jgi:signal transduction histidine kinase
VKKSFLKWPWPLSPLSRKLAWSIILASSIVTFFVTAIQLFYDYRREMDGIALTFSYIEKSYQGVIAAALWNVNLESLQRIDSGLRDLPNIDYLQISFAEEPQAQPSKNSHLIFHEVDIYYHHDQKPQLVGRIRMGSNINRVYETLSRKLLLILLSQGAKTFLVAAFMLYIFESQIMSHLRRIAGYARGLHIENRRFVPASELIDFNHLQGELKDVVAALREMQKNIQDSYVELEQTETRLRNLNASLEDEVEKRIQENERQQVLIQNSARLSALGEMAGNIAHEINNPLTIIAGYLRIIRSHLGSTRLTPEKLAFFGQKAEETVERITGIVSGLLRLSRNDGKANLQAHDLNAIVQDVVNLCRMKFLHHDIRFDVDMPDSKINVDCRPVEIGQIIINLLNNAHDAVMGCPDPHIALKLSQEGLHARIAVLDNGPGIPQNIRTKIMEPFFTTKTYGQGTGLGLSISQAIAQQHGGRIYLDEENPKTCFVLELPIRMNFPSDS